MAGLFVSFAVAVLRCLIMYIVALKLILVHFEMLYFIIQNHNIC